MLTAALATSAVPSSEIALRLEQLGSPVRVLYVAAHPDDENTQMLTWLARGRKVRAAYLSLTRGDGGQNLIGAEQRPLLGLIRTHELLAARNLDGAEQMFTRLRDFGYSKSAEEAMRIWGANDALEEVVRVFRTFRPHVVITRFPEEGRTHGHHLASAQLAHLAFDAAGDKSRFPAQIAEGLRTWKPQRLYYNFPHFWASRGREPPPGRRFDVDVGGYDAGAGLSYGEISAFSRSMHKSQGFGASARTGPWKETLVMLEGEADGDDPLAGLPSWADVPGGEDFAKAVQFALRSYDARRPGALIPLLGRAHAAAAAIEEAELAKEMKARVEALLHACAGMLIEARAERAEAQPGAKVPVKLRVLTRAPGVSVVLRSLRGPGVNATPRAVLESHQLWEQEVELVVPEDAEPTRPHWLAEPPLEARYPVDAAAALAPDSTPPLNIVFELGIGGVGTTFPVAVRRHWVDPVQGERTEPLEVAPAVSVTPAVSVLLVPSGAAQTLAFDVRAGPEGFEGTLDFASEAKVEPAEISLKLDAEKSQRIEVGVRMDVPGTLRARVRGKTGEAAPAWGRWVVDHPHLPRLVHRALAEVRLVPVRLERPKGPIGYIPGSGDAVADILGRAGIPVETLDASSLRPGGLDRFAAVLVGIRAFNVNKELIAAREELMNYVREGGTLVVQYNTKNWSAKLDIQFGPEPISISRDRVTDETAEVRFLVPNHPLLSRPHRITQTDFDGWVQERGLYFSDEWHEGYTPLFSMNDPGAEPSEGSTLYRRYGKGHFVFSGLSFFRQLPAGVPGALRLLVNFLAAGDFEDDK